MLAWTACLIGNIISVPKGSSSEKGSWQGGQNRVEQPRPADQPESQADRQSIDWPLAECGAWDLLMQKQKGARPPAKVHTVQLPRCMNKCPGAGTGELDMVEQLLAQGVGISVTDKSGWTPLLWAASGGHSLVGQRPASEQHAPVPLDAASHWPSCCHARCHASFQSIQPLITLLAP